MNLFRPTLHGKKVEFVKTRLFRSDFFFRLWKTSTLHGKLEFFKKFSNFQKVFQLSLPTLPSQHCTGMTDIVEGEPSPSPRASPNPEASPPSNDWRSMSGGEIYDRLIQKGAKLGTQANKVIRRLKKRGRFAEDSTLAKNKGTPIGPAPTRFTNYFAISLRKYCARRKHRIKIIKTICPRCQNDLGHMVFRFPICSTGPVYFFSKMFRKSH